MIATPQASPWLRLVNGDPLPWLLDGEQPAVRHRALRELLDRPEDDVDVRDASRAAMASDPIAAILASQERVGYWVKPGPGYSPKYRATVWQVIFLDQLGADGSDERVQAACRYLLAHTQSSSGGFACSGSKNEGPPPPSMVIHCLNGNLLRALLGLGFGSDERVLRAIDWQARSITGDGVERYYDSGTSGPGFCCVANEKLPCAWGAVKALLALSRVPDDKKTPQVKHAVAQGAEFLLGRDPAVADYTMGWGNQRPSSSWFKLGFPSGYVADVLQNLEVLCELGFAGDARLDRAIRWLLSKQDGQGRWRNEYAYNGKTWVDFEKQGQPSRWVTLRACRVLKMAQLAESGALLGRGDQGS
jgi:hypothetical protein